MNLEELEQLFHVNPNELMKMMADTLGPDATQEDVEAAVMEMMANVGKMISWNFINLGQKSTSLSSHELLPALSSL